MDFVFRCVVPQRELHGVVRAHKVLVFQVFDVLHCFSAPVEACRQIHRPLHFNHAGHQREIGEMAAEPSQIQRHCAFKRIFARFCVFVQHSPLRRGLRHGKGRLKILFADFRLRVARQGGGETPIARQRGGVLRFGQMLFQGVHHGGAPLFAQRGNALGGKCRPGGNPAMLRMAGAMRVGHPGVGEQIVLQLRQRHALVFQLDDAVLAAEQLQSAAVQPHRICGLPHPAAPRRGYLKNVFFVYRSLYCGQQFPRTALPQRDDAGFRAAVHIVRGKAQLLLQQRGGGLRQHSARADDAAHMLPQPRPIAPFAQAVQQRGAGNPHAFAARIGQQQFGIHALPPPDCPARRQRHEHAEGQPV